jgi:hypothetical protein
MSNVELQVRDALLAEVPVRTDWVPSWDDVLSRADVMPGRGRVRPRRRRRRLLVALAVFLVIAAVTGTALAAFGVNPFAGLSSWLRSAPGSLAPLREQRAFTRRNAATYAVFPKNTRLRLLRQISAGGTTLALLGFRTGSSLCLRLVRSDQPGATGANQCVTLSELQATRAPVLVASQAVFILARNSPRPTAVYGIFGFADDSVGAIDTDWLHGAQQTAHPADNVFLALRPERFGAHGEAPWATDPVFRVNATTRHGRRFTVPFASDAMPRSRIPSYSRPVVPTGADLPGPSRPTAAITNRGIAWLIGHELHGEAFVLPHAPGTSLSNVVFSRSIQPDPASPFRVGLTLTRGPRRRLAGGLFSANAVDVLRPHRLTLCVRALIPLSSRSYAARGGYWGPACTRLDAAGRIFPDDTPISVAIASPDTGHLAYAAQFTRLYGLAADGITRIDAYLAKGPVVAAALRDNVWTVDLPAVELPAKLVAYNVKHQPVWVSVPSLLVPSTIVPCPRAARPAPHREPKPFERLDLGSLTVSGLRVVGATPTQVARTLGPPQVKRPQTLTPDNRSQLFLYDGSTLNAGLVVYFIRPPNARGDQLRAVRLTYHAADLIDPQLGPLLRIQPTALERRIIDKDATTYRRSVSYGSNPSLGCNGTFETRRPGIQVLFGLDPYLSMRPFLTIRTDFFAASPATG